MSIESVYQSLLHRSPDQGAYSTYAGLSDDEIANAIYGSAEYAGLQQQSQPQQQQQPDQNISAVQNGPQGGGGADANTVNQLFQQYLGRPADQSGLGTFTGMDTQSIINGILGSPEYTQSHQQQQTTMNSGAGYNPYTQGGSSQLSANPDPTQPFNFVPSPYVTANNPFSAPINNAYQSLLGRPATQAEIASNTQMLQAKPDDYGIFLSNLSNSPEAAAAAASNKQQLIGGTPAYVGLGDEQSKAAVDPLTNTLTWLGAAYPNYTPSKDTGLSSIANTLGSYIVPAAIGVMGGGALGALLGAGTGAAGGSLAASGGLDLGTGFTGAAYGTGAAGGSLTAGYDLANLVSQGITDPAQLAQIMEINYGVDPFLASDAANLAATGYGADAINQVLGYGYNAADLAGTGITSYPTLSPSDISSLTGADAAGTGLSGSTLAKLLGLGASALGKVGSTTSQVPKYLPPSLQNVLPTSSKPATNYGSGGGLSNQAALPGIYREPFSPFAFGNQQPVQSGRNVAPTDFLGNLNKSAVDTSSLGQMKSSTPSSSKLNFFSSLFS